MKMDFSKDELAMVYQYAAGTKEDTYHPKAGRHPGAGVPPLYR